MTAPAFTPPGAQPGQRLANGQLVLPGGYDDARAQAPGAAPQQPQYAMPWQAPTAPPQQQAPNWQGQGNPNPPQFAGQAPPNPYPMPPQGWQGQNSPVGPAFAPQAPIPQPAPQAWQGQQPWQQQGQFPSQQAPAPQQPQYQQQPAGVDLRSRLAGANVPAELQGRTVEELIAIHNGLRQIHLTHLAGGQQQPGQVQQPAPVQVPAPVAGQAPNAPTGQIWDWRDPGGSSARITEQVINRAIDERLAPALAPMQQAAMIGQINNARQQAMAQVGPQRFAQLEAAINQSLGGIDPRALTNPGVWVVAAERAAGQMLLRGQAAQPAFQGQGQNGGPGAYQVQQVPPGAQPLPNLGTFFTEQPNQGGPGAQQMMLTPMQMQYADQMGMPHAVYAAWAGGQAPAGGGR